MFPSLSSSVFVFFFGLAIGSFLNVLILRIPNGASIRGRSRCMACQRSLSWFELLPFVSYVVLRGKCRSCRGVISLQYPLVELVTAALFVLAWSYNCWSVVSCQLSVATVRDLFFLSVLLVLFVQDLRFHILPDSITLPAIGVAIVFWFFPTFNFQLSTFNLLALVIGSGFFLLQWLLSRGRWVGAGDIRLGALMGAILGWPGILVALFLSYVSGAVVAIGLLLAGRATRKSQIPFGTFLTASTVVTMFWGEQMVEWYSRIIGL